VTTFLWILAAIGAVVFAFMLAYALGRATGEAPASKAPDERGSRFARDNPRAPNPAAFLVALVVIGGITALVVALALT
jgi:RsiW-degrading membrane proteinase PrsW (M82 family)